MTPGPRPPGYGRGALSDLLPGIGARLGLGGGDVLGLPDARRYLVLLIDGLGWDSWSGADGWGLGASVSPIDAGAPSTTATSLTSLGTGLPPGQHGMAGYSFRLGQEIFSPLRWPKRVSADDVQPRLTWFQRLAKAGVGVAQVAAAEFGATGLTRAAFAGARFDGVPDEDDLDALARRAAWSVAAEPSVGYLYHRALDHAGHSAGVGSAPWWEQLRRAGELVGRVREALPADAVLIVVGDHGMVDVPRGERVVIEECPALARGVDLVGGEARFRQLYTDEPDAVARRWADELGERAWVMRRDEAIEAGWFGEVAPGLASRWGDVIVAARGTFGALTTAFPKEWTLRGMHGSLTDAELSVPLAVL